MSDIRIKLFRQQQHVYKDPKRIIGAFAGKRGGKSLVGSLKTIDILEKKPNGYLFTEDEPYLAIVCAPTVSMMRRLSWKKFLSYARPFINDMEKDINKTHYEGKWHDGSEFIGMSADKPERLEGVKAGVIWLDEIFQMSERFFLECMARVADTEGYLICTGSLGVQYVNPKLHWAHYYFKDHPDDQTSCYEWTTADNPYFPKQELERLKQVLDPQTYRAMFELTWDFTPRSAVYADFDDDNIVNYVYNPKLPVYISIDWGWAHEMACGFFQYHPRTDTVYLFDEIISSKLTLEKLYRRIMTRPYRIDGWVCDIAGNQEREQLGISNIRWFRNNHNISFKYRKKGVQYGISIVRSYVKDGKGRKRFLISSQCKKSIDGMKQYKYREKDGIILNENPLDKDDDAVDMIRYYFINRHDKNLVQPSATMIKYM